MVEECSIEEGDWFEVARLLMDNIIRNFQQPGLQEQIPFTIENNAKTIGIIVHVKNVVPYGVLPGMF